MIPSPPAAPAGPSASVEVPRQPSFWRRLFAFVGPAYLVSVGYMDPGNWATDIAAGSRVGYALIWVLLMSNIMALLLQSLSARLGIVAGVDLAQACRQMFGRKIAIALWLLAELAITATDLAEVLGSAIGLQLLLGIPLTLGVLITALDTFLILLLHGRGVRATEAFIVALITVIGLCLAVDVVLAQPAWGELAKGFVPSLPGSGALYLAIGMLGATVMPHNIYLHSALVQSRHVLRTPASIRAGLRFNVFDSAVALNGAFFVNAALLVMAAATFYRTGHHAVAEIQDAHQLLEPILGTHLAPVAFAVGLIASGQSSTITGTLAGQIVMEGFVRIRLRPLIRRLVTRAAAITPALITILVLGEAATGRLLVLSQVILSLQLSFAVIPLIHCTSDRRWMGSFTLRPLLQVVSWTVAGIIVFLNLRLVLQSTVSWAAAAGPRAWLIWSTVGPVAAALLLLLVQVTVQPIRGRLRQTAKAEPLGVHGPLELPELNPAPLPRRIAVAVDFSAADLPALRHALGLARAVGHSAKLFLFHVVESGAAKVIGQELSDAETRSDQEQLELYSNEFIQLGIDCSVALGHGDPVEQLTSMISEHQTELVILGGHGHRLVGDFVHGTTVDRLRHRVTVPVLVIPPGQGVTR